MLTVLNRTLGIFRFVHPLKMTEPCHNRHTALSDKDSHKVRDRAELGINQPAIRAEGETVGHVGDPITDEAGTRETGSGAIS